MEDEEEAYDSVMRKKKRQEGSELSMRYRRKTARCAGCCFSLLKSLKGPEDNGREEEEEGEEENESLASSRPTFVKGIDVTFHLSTRYFCSH